MSALDREDYHVQTGEGFIRIWSDTIYQSVDGFCEILNNTDDDDLVDSIMNVMPQDYEFLSNRYGTFVFGTGSDHTHTCGWTFNYSLVGDRCILTIRGIK